MKILVCSNSEHKLSATESVFKKLFPNEVVQVKGVKASSEINEQPVGHEETIKGALNRLKNAKTFMRGIVFDYCIAIENGLFKVEINHKTRWFDCAWVVVEDSNGNQRIALSSGLEFSESAVKKALEKGLETTTVGSIMTEETGCDGTDPQLFMTNNLVSRADMIKQALEIAIGQLQNITYIT